jgi:hypothetical protein
VSIVVVIDSWPSLALDVWQRRTAGDQPRDMGVPQIMEPQRREPLGRYCGHQLPPHVRVEVPVVQRPARPASEQEVVSRSALNPLLEQRGHGRAIVMVRRDRGVFGCPRW